MHDRLVPQEPWRTNKTVNLSGKHFLDIVEELLKTSWPNSRQTGLDKLDGYKRGTIDYFHGILAGRTRCLIWVKIISLKFSFNLLRHAGHIHYTSQPDLDKPDWSQHCTIGYFHGGIVEGRTIGLIWVKNIPSTFSSNCLRNVSQTIASQDWTILTAFNVFRYVSFRGLLQNGLDGWFEWKSISWKFSANLLTHAAAGAYTSQPEMATPDWDQRGTIG